MSKWINMQETKPNPKTKVWDIVANDGGIVLGQIRWFGRWRRYCFFPAPDTVFEQDCLRDIAQFIESETKKQRIKTQ